MGNYERLKEGGDLEFLAFPSITEQILKIRKQFPTGFGLSLAAQAALAWECEDDDATRRTLDALDKIEMLRSKEQAEQ